MGMRGRIKKCLPVNKLYLFLFAACTACAILAACLFLQRGVNGTAGGVNGNVTVDTSAADAGGGDGRPDAGLSGRKVYFSGFEDSVFGEHTELALENPEENRDFYMQYRILEADTGRECFESGLVASGKKVSWKPADVLGPGTYSMSIQMLPYYSPDGGETWMPLTSTSNSVSFTVLAGSGSEAADRHLTGNTDTE